MLSCVLPAAQVKAFSWPKIATRGVFTQELKAFQKTQDKDSTKIESGGFKQQLMGFKGLDSPRWHNI